MKTTSENLQYSHILTEFNRRVWAILLEKFAVMRSFMQLKIAGGEVSAEQIAMIKRPARRPFLVDCADTERFLAGVIPHEKASAKDDSAEWDGSAARDRLAKWASSDGSGDKDKMDWAKYRRGFAWYDSDNAESFGSYKFPHHDIKNDTLTVVSVESKRPWERCSERGADRRFRLAIARVSMTILPLTTKNSTKNPRSITARALHRSRLVSRAPRGVPHAPKTDPLLPCFR